MMQRYFRPSALMATGLFLLLVGCYGETSQTKLQYMPDMADSPTVKAQEDYLDPPEGSVSTTAVIYPEDMSVAEKEFVNPFPANESNQEQGKKLYNTYCSLCHGLSGKGGNSSTLTDAYPKAAIPDITRADMVAMKDGFFYMKISTGGPMMPSYGHATTSNERWQIVSYVRQLQGKN